MILGLELRPFCQGFVPAAHSPDSQRHAGDWQGGRGEGTGQRSASQPAGPCCPGRHSLFPGAARQTPDLPPGSCRAPGQGRCKEHPSVHKQLSRAGSDPPKGSGPGIVPFPGCCWEIQLGAGCSCSCRVIQRAGKGLNSIPGLTTHLL